ncbi:MAG: carbohydrate ABC transporter permease [Clostridium sp.]|nr:carbohydrate ABC transporter permease [Clostridium sp.]
MKSSLGSRVFDIFNVLLMCTMMLLILIPLLHVLSASFSDPSAYVRHEGLLWHPLDFCLDAYKAVAKNKNILTGYMNTIFIVVVGTTINLISTLVAAYCLSRKNVMWNGVLMLAIVFSMYFSGGMIPFYLVVKGVGLNGSIWSLIIPTAVNTYNLIIMRTAMASVPESLEESAKLDGANHWTILWKIMVPLVKPTIAVICLYYAVEHWNSWFNAMLFIRDKAGYPLQLVLREILLQNDTSAMTAVADDYLISETIQFATIVVATVPILAIYPFVQRYFVKGVMIVAVKG